MLGTGLFVINYDIKNVIKCFFLYYIKSLLLHIIVIDCIIDYFNDYNEYDVDDWMGVTMHYNI